MPETKVFIIGAGLSHNAGLPLQRDFTQLFLKADKYKKGKSLHLMPGLREFVEKTFGFKVGNKVDLYPQLEDLFTSIDLSANSGHHLGKGYPPHELRRMRRMFLSRIIRMLNSAYLDGRDKPSAERLMLMDFLSKIRIDEHRFVSLNWDTVLEGCFEELGLPFAPFYGHEIYPAEIRENILQKIKVSESRIFLTKMHGSLNWLYCDCCRRAYSVPTKQVAHIASQALSTAEATKLYGDDAKARLHCPACEVDLSFRLATFSFQKALHIPMFESSWLEAEKALRRSDRWVFVGYSLPSADFEFKYLLKRVAAAKSSPPAIQVVTVGNSDGTMSAAELSYRRFFGECDLEFFKGGLTDDAINKIIA